MNEMNEEEKKALAAWVTQFARLLQGESDTCLHCGATITGMQQIGRCVYASPCGCRQYQGKLPEKWKGKK